MKECQLKSSNEGKMPRDRKTLELVAIGASVGSGCTD